MNKKDLVFKCVKSNCTIFTALSFTFFSFAKIDLSLLKIYSSKNSIFFSFVPIYANKQVNKHIV